MFYRKAIVIREFMNHHTGVRRDLPPEILLTGGYFLTFPKKPQDFHETPLTKRVNLHYAI